MQIEKEINTKEESLKDIPFIKVALKADVNVSDYPFLEENLKDRLTEILIKKGYSIKNINIGYSLSYSQGDGFNFVGEITNKKGVTFLIKKINFHYEHEQTTTQEIVLKDGVYFGDLTDKQQLSLTKRYLKPFEEEYINICLDLKKLGYEIIEGIEEAKVLESGFFEFCELNNIEQDDLFNFEYATEPEKDFILIADSGNTNLKGLWIKNIKIKTSDFVKAEITEYQTKKFI